MWPSEQQALKFDRIPMEIEMNGFVLCKKSVEVPVGKGVRMRALRRQDHEIGNIHDTDAKIRNQLAQESCCCNHFEVDLYTDSDEYTYAWCIR